MLWPAARAAGGAVSARDWTCGLLAVPRWNARSCGEASATGRRRTLALELLKKRNFKPWPKECWCRRRRRRGRGVCGGPGDVLEVYVHREHHGVKPWGLDETSPEYPGSGDPASPVHQGAPDSGSAYDFELPDAATGEQPAQGCHSPPLEGWRRVEVPGSGPSPMRRHGLSA